MDKWKHKPECTATECYCAGDQADPICDCGCPSWACECEDDDDELDMDKLYIDIGGEHG